MLGYKLFPLSCSLIARLLSCRLRGPSVLAQNSEMPVSVLAQLYTLFSDKRTTRNFFLGNIIRLFEKCTSSEEVQLMLYHTSLISIPPPYLVQTDVDFFQYLAELILSLPYSYTDEVR